MRKLTQILEAIRAVRLAKRKFLRLHAVDKALIEPLLDRMAEDLRCVPSGVDNDMRDGGYRSPAD